MGGKISRFRDFVNKKKHSFDCSSENDETGHDPAVHGAKLEDRFYNNDSFSSPSVDPSDPQQQDAALSIQTEFRRHSAKKEVDSMKEEEAATKIQAGFRGFQDRQKVLEMKDPEEFAKLQGESSDKQPTEGEDEVDIDLNDPEVADAALKIQAGFRGHKARQEMKTMKDTESPPPKGADQSKSQESKGNDEEVDIDLNDPEVANAATKIQAGFRGHKTRQELKDKMKESETSTKEEKQDEIDIDLNDPEVSLAATKIQAGFRGHKTRQEMKAQKSQQEQETKEPPSEKTEESKGDNKEEEVDIDLNDPEVEKAATKIQAGFKGYKTRKEMKGGKPEDQETEKAPSSEQETKQDEEEEVDIDLNDPEVEKAAVKIQAGFKGFQARKEIKKQQESEGQTEAAPTTEAAKENKEEEIDIDLDDPETAKAALKIQAGFRGYQTRKELQGTKSDGQVESESKEEQSGETKDEAAGESEPKQEEAPSDEKQE